MQKFVLLCLMAALVAAAPQSLNDLTGTYSLWRPPTWPNFETCCYLQGANITLTGDKFSLKSIVMGPCAQYLPGTTGMANMQLNGDVKDLATSGKVSANMSFFTMAGVHTMDKVYDVLYTVERSPAPVDILTLTMQGDSNCTFELRNDTMKATTFFSKFLAKMQTMQNKLDTFFVRSADDFTGKFSLWRPPTWQNFSTCCYIGGANVTYDASAKEFTMSTLSMGPCAEHLPGTNGIVKMKLTKGDYADDVLTMGASFFTTSGKQIKDYSFTVTKSIELTPAPVDIYVYHSDADGSDTSCDFKLRKDTY